MDGRKLLKGSRWCSAVVVDAGPYRVTHVVPEYFLLTSNSKFRHRAGSQYNLTARRNFKSEANISYSATTWVTLYLA